MPKGVEGEFALNTEGVERLISPDDDGEVNVKFEIEVQCDPGKPFTAIQLDAIIVDDLIKLSDFVVSVIVIVTRSHWQSTRHI